jgi:hypothetical protein
MEAVEDKMVEIARFTYPADAQTLMALLRSEGIECYLRDELSSQIMGGYADIGGARVEILESEVQHALDVMKEGGYEIPKENEEPEGVQTVSGFAKHIPFLRNYSLEKQIIIILVTVAVLLGLFVYLGSLLSAN